jgi:hypothetical protein
MALRRWQPSTYRGLVSSAGNARVLNAWTEAVTRFGSGPDDIHYGWLREQVELSAVEEFYSRQLEAAAIGTNAAPEGVCSAYNRSQ